MEKPLWMICITHMFIEIYLLIQVALIPVLIREFQLSLLEASLIATVPATVTLLMNIPSGFLADRFNTNTLLFVSMLIEGLSALLVSQTNNFWMLVFGVSLLKISSPIYHISGLSHMSRLAQPEHMSMSVGFHNALGNVGSAIGVVSLAFFLSTVGWRWTYMIWAVPILIWGFVILTSRQLNAELSEKVKTKKQNGLTRLSLVFSFSFLVFLVATGIREIGSTGISTFMTTYFVRTRNLTDSTASLIFGLGPFIGIVGSLGGGYLGTRIGAKKALSWAIFGCAVSLSFLAFMWELYLLIPVYLLYAFFANAVWSPMNTIVASVTPETERGFAYSFYFFTEGLTGSIAPTLGAVVIELSDVWFVFPFSIFFLIIGMILLQFLRHPKLQ